MKRKMESNEQVVKKPKVVTPQTCSSPQDSKGDDSSDATKTTSSQDFEASDKKQYKDTCSPMSKQIHKSRKQRMDLDHVHGISVPHNIEKNGQSEEGNAEELDETVCKPIEGNNSTEQPRQTPNNFVDKITTQRIFLCGVCKESKDGGDDKHEKERERQVEQVSQTKDTPTFNLMCIYDGTPDEDDNVSDGLKQVSGDDDEEEIEGDVEKSRDGATKSKNEKEYDTGSYNEVQQSTSKAVKDDYALVKTQSKPFQRLWTEEDEKTLLEAIRNYKAVHGNEPNSDDLFNMIKGKTSFEPNLKQVKNKTRSLRRIKKTPRQRMIDAEKHLLCSSDKIRGVNKMSSTIGQSSKRKEMLKDAEIASIVMTLFQGSEVDEVLMLETGISKVAQLISSGLPTKWKVMIKAQVNQYLRGLEDKKSKLELFLKMMEIETGEHDDNDIE